MNKLFSGSFRDPRGRIVIKDGEVYRIITSAGIKDFEAVKETGFLQELVQKGKLVPFEEVKNTGISAAADAVRVLQHPRLAFISYPYEWCFSALKAAALLHLDIQLRALDRGIVLSDATAYNIQFNGTTPVFIDHLSFRPYREGEFWLGHRQFCEQFIAPLVLHAWLGIPYHAWYRGSLEGVSISDCARLLPWKAWLSPTLLTNIMLPARLERSGKRGGNKEVSDRIAKRKLPRASYAGMLRSLQGFISKLQLKNTTKTVWHDYEKNNIYDEAEAGKKRDFINDFITQTRPGIVWDIGCNTGEYAQAALGAGAGQVIGFEYDMGALEQSFNRANDNRMQFLPLYMDLANPSPSQGWGQGERDGISERKNADAIIALAIIHHLCIGRNIPLDAAVSWLVSLAPAGVIEFVPKTDPMVQELLALREDIFDSYTEDLFIAEVSRHANILKTKNVTKSSRLLVSYLA